MVRKGQTQIILAPRLCSSNHIMLVLRKDDIVGVGRSAEIIHGSVIYGRQGLETPRLGQAEMSDRYRVPDGERSMRRSRQARKYSGCLDPAEIQGGI